jgi:pimeloyl-ACP methyl ester carboxylesterase
MRILLLVFAALCPFGNMSAADKYSMEEGFADANGLLIYYLQVGAGQPLVILHGGPGSSHEYLLPSLLPLTRDNRLIFIDERGSGRSQKIEDPSGYTVENMVEDVEGVRVSLGLGKINLIDGNLKSVEYTDRLGILHVPTLIVVGDHDECDPTLSREMNTLIPGSKLTVLPKSGHLTFVDQNEMFLRAVGDFVK